MEAAKLRQLLEQAAPDWSRVQEIRIRAGYPVVLISDGQEYMVSDGQKHVSGARVKPTADRQLIREILGIFSKHSLYAFEDEIRQGFLTIEGGHRVGLAGKAVLEAGNGLGTVGTRIGTYPAGNHAALRTIKDISGLNIRLAHEKKGCADSIVSQLYDTDGTVFDTLILSPPGAGKTTLLRDLVRQISNGTAYGPGAAVSVVDERSELAACYQGVPQCDLGCRTDVMDACPKVTGMYMMIRAMSPRVLAVDEIGTREDLEAMRYVMNCGCRILATAHGSSVADLDKKPVLSEMVREGMFSRYVVLSKNPHPGTVAGVFDENRKAVPFL